MRNVHGLTIWTMIYCGMIFACLFLEMSSSYFTFFKIVSCLHFVFFALLYFSRKSPITTIIGFGDIALLIFFIDSFTRKRKSSFWIGFNLFLLAVVIFQYYFPYLSEVYRLKKLEKMKKELELIKRYKENNRSGYR